MSTRIERESTITSAKDIAQRMKTIEWERVSQDLDAQGSAIVKRLITRPSATDWPSCTWKTASSAAEW